MRLSAAIRAVGLVVAICVSAATLAQPTPVREMMQASGMVEQFADLGEQFREGVRQAAERQAGLPAEFVDVLTDTTAKAFDGERFLADLEAGLVETLTAEEVAALTGFYGTPLGERIKAAEVAASTKEVRAEIEANRDQLRAGLEREPERLAALERIDAAILGTEISVSMVQSMMYAMIVGMAEAQGRPVDPEQFEAVERQIEGARPMLVAELSGQMRLTFARTYRDLSVSELSDYAAFLETEKARAVYAAVYAASDGIFAMRGREVGQGLGAAMREKRT